MRDAAGGMILSGLNRISPSRDGPPEKIPPHHKTGRIVEKADGHPLPSVVLRTFFLDELDEALKVCRVDIRQDAVAEVEHMA